MLPKDKGRKGGTMRSAGVLEILFSVGARREPKGAVGVVASALAFATTCYVLYAAVLAIVDPLVMVAIFFSLMLALLFLTVDVHPNGGDRPTPLFDLVASAVAVACGVYFLVQGDVLAQRISLLDPLTPLDVAVGTAVCVLTVEASRRTVGLGLTLIVVIMIAYNLFGDRLSGVLRHGLITYDHFLDQTMFTTNGVFGAPLRVAATYAFLFVLFGTLLEKCGGSDFFFKIAAVVSGRQVGGPAKVAVFSSALYGTVSGSPTSDVVTTGSVTIPMMRRLGYPRTLAGAIEVSASSSGGLIPPVMASAAFIMVEVTGIPYLDIVQAAVIPAALYLIGVLAQVHFLSHRYGLGQMDPDMIPTARNAMQDGGLFILPLVTIVYALLEGYSISYVAVGGILSVIAVAMVRRQTRPGVVALFDIMVLAARRMVPVAAACAAAGLVVGGISMTGLSGKLAIGLFALAGDSAFLVLLIAGLIAILLGMGMPTPSAYIMSAVLIAPALISLGFEMMSVHFFLLYFAALSAMTPPVAVAAYAAASLAEANPLAIAARACALAAPAFIMPFVFIHRPELLGEGNTLVVLSAFATSAVGVILLAVALAAFFRGPLSMIGRLALAVGGVMLLMPGLLTDGMGLAVAVVVLLVETVLRRDGSASPAESSTPSGRERASADRPGTND